MKVKSKYNGQEIIHKSYAELVRWADSNKVFVTKSGLKVLKGNTSTLICTGANGSKIEISRYTNP